MPLIQLIGLWIASSHTALEYLLTCCSAGIWLLPESPRWLVSKDRHEKALKVLAKVSTLHRFPSSGNSS